MLPKYSINMFENQIEKVKEDILSTIVLNKQFIYLPELISNPDIHKAYKTYFNAEVEWWLYEEQMKRQSNQNFDMMDSEIHTFLIQFDNLLKKNARFDRLGLESLVNFAVKTRLNMLCRPRTTLKWFVYRGEQIKPFYEIIKRMDYLYDYKYIIDGFMHWAEDNDIWRQSKELISSNEFTKIIDKIDNEFIYNLSPDSFVDIIKPMFEFFNDVDSIDVRTIPIEALIIFLDDKGIFPIARSMEKLLREDNIETITKSDFSDYIYTLLGEIEKKAETKPGSSIILQEGIEIKSNEPVNLENDALDIEMESLVNVSEEEIVKEDIPEPPLNLDDEKDESEIEILQTDKITEHETSISVEIKNYISNLNDSELEEEKEIQSPSIQLSERPYHPISLTELINKKYEDKFISKLFNKDMAKYFVLINYLEECYSWREAAKKIDSSFSEKSIDPNSTLAVEFRNLIQKRYEI
jgi:hypothetical protein